MNIALDTDWHFSLCFMSPDHILVVGLMFIRLCPTFKCNILTYNTSLYTRERQRYNEKDIERKRATSSECTHRVNKNDRKEKKIDWRAHSFYHIYAYKDDALLWMCMCV